MRTRVQVILDDDERAAFARRAAAEGLSLSAWLHDAGRQRLRAVRPSNLSSRDASSKRPGRHHGLGARDLVHLAVYRRRNVAALRTYDHALAAAFRG